MKQVKSFFSKYIYGDDETPDAADDKKKDVAAVPGKDKAAMPAISTPAANVVSGDGIAGYNADLVVDKIAGSSITAIQEARDAIATVLANANIPGNDYYEFQLALSSAAFKSITSESQRFQVAFASFAAAGMTKDKLIETGRHYGVVIDDALKAFESHYKLLYGQKVDGPKAVIEKKQQEIQEICKRLEQLNAEIKTIGDSVTEEETGLNIRKNAFSKAAEEAKNVIGSDLTKIDQYIQ